METHATTPIQIEKQHQGNWKTKSECNALRVYMLKYYTKSGNLFKTLIWISLYYNTGLLRLCINNVLDAWALWKLFQYYCKLSWNYLEIFFFFFVWESICVDRRGFFSRCYMVCLGWVVIMILGKIIFYILWTVLPQHDNGPKAEAGCMRNIIKNCNKKNCKYIEQLAYS